MGVTSLEELQKSFKKWNAGKAKEQEMMAKANNAAPINTTVPKPIPVLRRQQIAQGTDPASMSLAAKEAELNAKRILGQTNAQQYAKRFEMPLADNADENMRKYANQSPQERYNDINKQAEAITSKGVNATTKDFEKLEELRNIGANLEEQMKAEDNAPLGQYGKGNIDLTNRPKYRNEDGSISTVRSMSFNEDGEEILVPTIDYDAFGNPRLLSDAEAIDRYHRTGEYLGKFKTVEEANKYAEKLHKEQEEMIDDKSLILSDEEYAALDEEARRITEKGVNATPQELERYQDILRIVEKSEAEKERQAILGGKNHVVDNATYQKLMSDKRFANDIDTLVNVEWNNADQDATVSPEWAEAYGAKNITGGLTKEQFYTQLSKRYDLTKEQLHDIALSRKAEIESGENQRYAESLANFGEEHPLLGSAGSLLGTVGSAVEGPLNTLIGGIAGDDRYMSRMFDTTKNAPREGVKRNMEHDLTKGLYDVGMGVADMGAGALVGNAPAVLAGNTMNRTMLESLDRGIDPRRAAVYSGASGVVDYITNTIGLDKAKELASSAILQDAGLDAIGERIALAGIAGYGEAGENLVQDMAQTFIDRVINGQNSELNQALNARIASGMSEEDAIKEVAREFANQELMSAATGLGMGAAMNLGQAANNYVTSGLAGKALENYANRNSENVWNALREWEAQQRIPRVGEVESAIAEPNNVEVAPENVVYHSGVLSKLNKSETRGKMSEGTRDTGYFGTGHYFVDGAHKGELDNNSHYSKKPYSSVDISKYNNLYKADTDAKASALHDFSQRFMRYVNGHNNKYFVDDEGRIIPEERAEYIDDLYNLFRELFPEQNTNREAFEAELENYKNNHRDVQLDDRSDSEFTQFMKSMGYNGVDTRGTNSANTERGVVIYDLDEDSILQSNVDDSDTKNGLMNTRVRNEGQSVFDADEDTRIGKIIEGQEKQKAIQDEYHRTFDDTALNEADKRVNEISKQLDTLENDTKPYYESLLTNEDALNREVNQRVREFGELGLDVDPDEERASILSSAEQGIVEADAKIAELNQELVDAQEALKAEQFKANDAYNRAKAKVNEVDYINEEKGIHKLPDNIQEIAKNNWNEVKKMQPVATVKKGLFKDGDRNIFDKVGKYWKKWNNKAHNEVLGDVVLTRRTAKDSLAHNMLTSRKADTFATVPDVIEKGKIIDYQPRWKNRNYDTAIIVAPTIIENENGVGEEYMTLVIVRRNSDMQKFYTHDALSIKKNESSYETREASSDTHSEGEGSSSVYSILQRLAEDKLNYETENQVNVGNTLPRVGEPQSLLAENQPNKVMAEDTGLRNKNNTEPEVENEEPTVIEEELPSKDSFVRPGEARFMTRDAIDSSVITRKEYDTSPVLQEIAQIARHSNDQVYAAAEQEVREHGKEWFNDVIKGNKILGSDPDKADYDFNTGMIMLQGLADRIQLAKTPEEKARFTTLRNALLAKMRAFSTNAARTLQAHKMWVNTADGAMLANDTIRAKRVADYMSTHQEQSRENARIAQALKLQGYDGSMDVERVPKTHEEIRQEVINTIDREFSSVRDRFNDTAIDYLTALAEDKSVPIWQIRDELEHFLNHGEFYTIDESTNVTLEKSSKLARALDGAVNGKETTKVEKAEDGYYKTREKVINTLNEDYASVRDQFNDNDIDFIVTMLMEKLPTWQIEDEIRHKLEHGTWYTIDESIPEKAKHSKELASILKKVGEPEKTKGAVNEETGYPEKSHATYVEEVTNTLNSSEMASLGLNTPTDIEVLATYLEEGVSKKAIADSIAYRLATGEWPTLTEGLEPQSAQSSRIRNAINQMANEANGVEESAPMSLDRQIELVKHAFENNKEKFPHELSDADYRYLATMLQNGASVQEIKSKLDYYAHYGKFEIDPSVQERVYQLGRYMDNLDPESEKYDRAQLEMFRLLANESDEKASAFDKFEAWRYLAMLGNPKTMLRNWFGNQIFAGFTGLSNTLAALGEAGVDKLSRATGHDGIERKRAVYNPFSKENRELTKALKKDFNLKRYVSGAGTKYKDMKKGIEDAKEVFDSDAMRFIQDVVDRGISDTSAVRRKYATSLLGYMKANGLTEADLKASYEYDELRHLSRNMVLTPKEQAKLKGLKSTAEKMEKARDFALEQAKYATFHEDNKYAKALAKFSGSSKVAKVFVDGLVPFKSTPLNVLRSGIEYSPLGISRSGYLMIKHAVENTKNHKENWGETYKTKKGKEITRTSVNDVIESWSRSLTGTGLAYLGYMLFGKGIITSSRDDEKYQDQLEGLQNFAIKLNINGKDYTYTIDWASPMAMPLLMGAEIKKIFEDNGKSDKDFSPSDFLDVCNSILNPVMETSMLQGISNSIESTSRALGSEGGASDKAGTILTAWGANLASSYASQGIPTLAGQFARAIDDTRRSTDTITENPMGSELERTGRKIMNKIPGISRLNEPYINARGEEEKNFLGYKKGETGKNVGRFLGNLAYQMVSPGYIDEVDTRKSDEIARDVYNSRQDENDPNSSFINDSEVFAKWASSPKVNGQKLTPKQAHDYREAGYSVREAIREALANEDWFNDLPATERNEILKKTNYLANEIGSKAAVPEYESSNKLYAEYAKTISAGDGKEKTGIQNVVDYLRNEAHGSNVKDALGTSADWASKIYDENDPDRLTKYNEYREMAETKGLDLTETDFLTYEQNGKDTLEKVLNYKVHAKNVGIDSDNKQFMKLVDSKVPDADIKTAYDAIKSTKAGTDELGRDKALEFNETTYNIYKNDGGQKGLDRYVKFKRANVSYDLYKQAKKAIPSLSENKYIRTFHDMDGYTADGYKAPDGDISQKELLYYFNENGLDADEVDEMWAAYGKVSGKDAWTMIPVLKKNKQNQYYWATENPNK